MDLNNLVEQGFMGICSGGIAWSAVFLARISGSVSKLNKQVAVILERTAWHEKEIERHDHRISILENRRKA